MTRDQENAVIRAVISGDADAYEALVREYEKNVYNLALRMTGNTEDAYDMSQEAFLKAYNSLPSFRGDSKFSVWLYRIVSNVCLDFLRSRTRKPTVSLSTENDEGEEVELDIADEELTPEKELDRKLTRDAVQRGLKSLPAEHREILLLREIQGLSYEEISEALGLEVGTVKSRIFRARKKLCAFLIQDGNIPEYISSSKSRGGDLS